MDRKELRERAERYRRMLRSVDDPKTRSVLMEMAQQYEAAAAEDEGNEAGITESAQEELDQPDD